MTKTKRLQSFSDDDAPRAKIARAKELLSTLLQHIDGEKKNTRDIASLRYNMPFISQTALAAICKHANENGGLPAIHSSREIREARDAACVKACTAWGPLHKKVSFEDSDMTVEIQDPWAMLCHN